MRAEFEPMRDAKKGMRVQKRVGDSTRCGMRKRNSESGAERRVASQKGEYEKEPGLERPRSFGFLHRGSRLNSTQISSLDSRFEFLFRIPHRVESPHSSLLPNPAFNRAALSESSRLSAAPRFPSRARASVRDHPAPRARVAIEPIASRCPASASERI